MTNLPSQMMICSLDTLADLICVSRALPCCTTTLCIFICAELDLMHEDRIQVRDICNFSWPLFQLRGNSVGLTKYRYDVPERARERKESDHEKNFVWYSGICRLCTL
jgi:hypothetical protein